MSTAHCASLVLLLVENTECLTSPETGSYQALNQPPVLCFHSVFYCHVVVDILIWAFLCGSCHGVIVPGGHLVSIKAVALPVMTNHRLGKALCLRDFAQSLHANDLCTVHEVVFGTQIC